MLLHLLVRHMQNQHVGLNYRLVGKLYQLTNVGYLIMFLFMEQVPAVATQALLVAVKSVNLLQLVHCQL